MSAFFANIWKTIREFLASKTKKEKIRMLIFAVILLSLAVVATVLLNQVDYEILYSGLTPEEAGVINSALTSMSVKHKTEGLSTMTIYVPREKVSDLRSRLAAEGYTPSKGFDYSLFENAMNFGTTDTEQQMYTVLMRQDMIKTQILQLDKIQDCYVLLNIPQSSPYVLTKNQQQPSATVILTTRNNEPLTSTEVKVIFDMVVNGVGGTISYDKITITDALANPYYISETGEDANDGVIRDRLALENQTRRSLEEQVLALLTPVFGYSRVKCAANLKLNFDDVRSEEIVFAPPVDGETEGMILSLYELYEISRYGDEAEGIPGTDTNAMGVAEYPYGELDENELFEKVVREINYEMNQTTTQITRAKGSVADLSIGILLDSSAVPEDYTAEVRRLVANALGVKESLVSVERLPFVEYDTTIAQVLSEQQAFQDMLNSRELIRTIIICFTVLLTAAALILFLRSIFIKKPEPALVTADGDLLEDGLDAYIGGDDSDEALLSEMHSDADGSADNVVLNPLNELKRMIDNDPVSVAQLLRNWLTDY